MRPLNYEVTSIEQIKALSSKIRIQILNVFYDGKERTNKQVAEELGMFPTKIHYHMKELEKVGLIEVIRTNHIGGIVEKYYLPVAKNIKIVSDKKELLMMSLAEEHFEAYKSKTEDEETLQHFNIFYLTKEEKLEFESELKSIYKKWMDKCGSKHEEEDGRAFRFVQLLFKNN